VLALGLGVGVHHRTPSLPLNTLRTSLKRPKVDGADGQTENGLVNKIQIGIKIGIDNQTNRTEKNIWTIR
jgi:hypothetical protein